MRMQLKDGRWVGYAEFGLTAGRPVIYCHGFPASRLEARFAHSSAQRLGARIVALDRPGYGLSTFVPRRRIEDWPLDVTEVADALGLERFAVLGVSGGAPYALACAKALQARVTALALVCGLGPLCPEDLAPFNLFARFVFGLTRRSPRSGRALVHVIGTLLRARADWVFSVLAGDLPESDRAILEDKNLRRMLVESVEEALHHGTRGAAWDLTLYVQNCAPPTALSVPTYVWHGERDTTVPCAMSKRLASRITCDADFSRTHGHYSLPILEIERILQPLINAP